MEPGDLRESPAGSGESDVGDWREVIPGGDEEEDSDANAAKMNGTKAENALRDAHDERDVGEHLHSPYEEELDPRIQAQQETQKAALSYERAVSMHTAAREMVYVAEQGLMADGKNTLDPTWQEMLNHATSKEAEARVQTLQKSLKRVILKSKPYFELKSQLNHILEEHKTKVLQLEQNVSKVKTCYSIALRNLEQISEQIHAQRGRDPAEEGIPTGCSGRSPPVGAESDARVQEEDGACGVGAVGKDRLDTALDLVDQYKEMENGKERERAGSDSLSVFSLQTIASDLEKYDSVEHLGDLSDVGSVTGDEGEKEKVGGKNKRDKLMETSNKDRQQQFSKQHHRSFSL
ncbi:hypothetical protein GOODEAATRI_010001 [Goodea atripinnis]|uniref:SH3 domain-binding protein 5 n=1 Tax=Goodea atripinnis TaxID=208336 RepID=A0ABV0PWS6_9TELE